VNRCKAGSVLLAVTIAVPAADALAGDNFQRPKGSQIQAKFAGMEMTDEVHWADTYGRDGTLTTYEMGKKRVGKWWVQRDELCHDWGKDMKGCGRMVQTFNASRFSMTSAECRSAVPAIHGMNEAFSTGSQNHQPPQPSV